MIIDKIRGFYRAAMIRKRTKMIPPDDRAISAVSQRVEVADDNDEDAHPSFERANTVGWMECDKIVKHRRDVCVLAQHAKLPIMMKRDVWRLADYELCQILYTSENAVVGVYMCGFSRELVVLKIYILNDENAFRLHQIEREVAIQIRLDHPNITRLYAAFRDDNRIVLVQEYDGAVNVRQFLARKGVLRLTEEVVRDVFMPQVLDALEYLHEHGVCHRDLKPENILVNERGMVRLCDFGVSIDLNDEVAASRCGTIGYMAPEVLRCPLKKTMWDNKDLKELHYAWKVDVWSIGIVTYELLVGMPPAPGGDVSPLPRFPKFMSACAVDFVSACLNRCASLRPCVQQMKESEWLTGPLPKNNVC